MQKKYAYIAMFLLFILQLTSCDNKEGGGGSYKEDSSGPIGLVSVFSSDDMYHALEEDLRDTLVLGKIFPGLYYPPEIMFPTRHFESDLFNRFKSTRLILDVQKGEPSIEMEKNKFSKPQAYVKVTGNDSKEILKLLKENQKEILDIFQWADYEFVLDGHRSKARQDKSPLDKLNVEMVIPRDFVIAEQQDDFIWFRKDKFNTIQNKDERDNGIVTDTSQDILNIMVFKVPYAKDDITMQDAHQIFDSITKLYTNGEKEPKEIYVKTNNGNDSIKTMVTDHIQVERMPALYDYYNFVEIDNSDDQRVYSTQGWWSMTLSQLGGPFTAKLIIDKKNKQLYVADAVMFAPLNHGVSKKRDYLISMQSLLTTFKIKP